MVMVPLAPARLLTVPARMSPVLMLKLSRPVEMLSRVVSLVMVTRRSTSVVNAGIDAPNVAETQVLPLKNSIVLPVSVPTVALPEVSDGMN